MELLPLDENRSRREAPAFRVGSLIGADSRAIEQGKLAEVFEESNYNSALANPSADAADQYLHGWKLAIIMSSLCFGTSLVALDVAIIGVAIPRITTDFHSL